MITEKDNVFYCDCGFSFQRGRSGAHDCADGLRNKLAESEARCAALAAENAGLKAKGRELLGEACAVYENLNKMIDPAIGDFIDGQTLHEFQFVLDCETPQTDTFLAEVRAQGVDSAINTVITMMNHQHPVTSKAIDIMRVHAYQLRKGVQS
ncbi:hypothetical protein N8S40_01210 [Enterobacter hormaechei subsp. steigerwaltii]|nr:hypothetical protein [Enterobacter hormaechei subsp. steigerwaltii]MCU2670009.1 hypothetical protein [Enterobacter hormaechei subsp. steigerwaltii]MCU2805093.1 hypothetical protein [Enterobacter hormaechei subsp. steigerwaltii]MCU2849075.1 hypothetical protein [Enterobacter hormaechei subsp. steigerwaltii]MCU2990445.1 hypothetical protein [Enterobacter hormaechei subsp. steigerwaltii]